MTIGIGGAGSKIAAKLDSASCVVNVSEVELDKLACAQKILAMVHGSGGQLRGSRKNPEIGRDAFLSVKRELMDRVGGEMLFAATGGGTGNGIASGILEELCRAPDVAATEATVFVLILPYAKLEPAEYVVNTIAFLQGALSEAIDSGNTGNIILVSNQLKFESRLAEDQYNQMIVDSLNVFLAVPRKGEELPLLDGHIDQEDFRLYLSRPFFNHFTYFDYDPAQSVEKQLERNLNPLLLPPDNPIEGMFLLEVPEGDDPTIFYALLEHFAASNVSPVFGVVENPEREKPFLTVSLLYSRKPDELVEDFNLISEEHTKAKVRKSLEQHVALPKLEVNLEREAKRVAKQRGSEESDVLAVLRRLGKL